MEMERVKYLISVYLRTRLMKIQTFLFWLVENDQSSLLSEQECKYIQIYYAMKNNHFKKAFLLDLPAACTNMHERYQKSPVDEPNLDEMVAVAITAPIG
jgi:GINS complex subunit 4